MFSETPTSIVVPLEGELEKYLENYLSVNFDSTQEVSAIKAQHDRWFGVVDGCQLRQALNELMDAFPEE